MNPPLKSGTASSDRPRRIDLGIRGKIVLPYLILTLVVAILGVFIVTLLIAGTIEERFNNQLVNAGQVAADGLIRVERNHLELWRILAVTEGLVDAVVSGDPDATRLVVEAPAANRRIDSVQVVDARHRVVLGLDRTPGDLYQGVTNQQIDNWEPLDRVLRGERDNLGDKYSGILLQSGQPYIFTVGPIRDGDRLVGAVMVGTRLDNALREIERDAIAKVSAYDQNGELLGSTLPPPEPGDPENRLPPDQVEAIIARAQPTERPEAFLSNLKRGRFDYRLVFGPLQIRRSVLGIYSVALESNFIVDSTLTSRLTFAVAFVLMTAAVLGIGLTVSRRLSQPILRLVKVSQNIAGGDLNQRTGLSGTDEIGKLGATFDHMTQKLQDRTRDLELLLQTHREEALKTRAILSSIADGVLVLDVHGRIIMLNAAAERMLGDMSTDFSAGIFSEQAPVQDDTIFDQPISALDTFEMRRFVINKRVISAHAAPVVTDTNQQLGTVVVLRDVTREAEVERLKDSFIEQVSHELRTPLTAVKGYSDLILQTGVGHIPDKYMEFLGIISHHADSLVTMITELLDISQIEAKSMNLRLERIDLNELVDVTLDEWRTQIAEKGLTLDVVTSTEPVLVTGDRRRLAWAIKQLVSNAYHYTEPGGRVEVAIAGDPQTATLTVTDTGIGITPEDQKYLFTRFFRSTTRVHSNDRGVGLGLYIVKAVVDAHRGRIEVHSEVGRGSIFRISLPTDELIGEPPISQIHDGE
jgi:two-component system phosphate regulon sensor histidine kinase PhoR